MGPIPPPAMNESRTCPACGTQLDRGRVAEMCPACLLRAVMESGPTQPPPDHLPPEPAEIQALFPELEIVGLIGRGGMGVVYQVRQPALDRFAALKVLPREFCARSGFRERFHREARTLAALNHPHIVTIHEFGERDGMFFFLMEFVDGGDLGRIIRAGTVTPAQALAIIPQICDALQYAHEAGVVHRDIKPGNILLDHRGRVKVADFGIAKMVGSGDAGVPNDYIAGTPEYMAPEQLEANAAVDHRADIYSLGAVFYELLTGHSPGFGMPELPSQRVQIDVRFDEVVLRAMALDPALRYQQVTEFREGVERVTRPAVWRTRSVVLAALGAAAVVVFGFMVSRRDAPSPSVADSLPPVVENGLGMRFRPLPGTGVKLSIWETRVRDWRAFAPAHEFKTANPDDPVTTSDGPRIREFCRWLTQSEQAAGRLAADMCYRLPTDREWSLAVGLKEPADAKPEELSAKPSDRYPWGTLAPAPAGAGNYADSTLRERLPTAVVIPAYYDGHPFVCPVGGFPPDASGFHDLGGNVWEATAESDDDSEPLGYRGGSWLAGSKDGDWNCLLASFRAKPEAVSPLEAGFRVILAKTGAVREPGLAEAARDGRLERVVALLAKGAPMDERDARGRTALHLAAAGGHAEVVLALLKGGADVHAQAKDGTTPLFGAAAAGHLQVVAALIQAGAKVRARSPMAGTEAIHAAAAGNHPEVMEFLVNQGADLGAVDNVGNAPLHYAANVGAGEAVTWLVGQKVAINARGTLQNTPLALAVQHGDVETCALLLRLGAAANPPAGDAVMTPLAIAASLGNPDLVELLLQRGADPKPPVLGLVAVTDLATLQLSRSKQFRDSVLAKLPLGLLPAKPGDRARTLRLLVAAGMPMEQTGSGGLTPLLNAAFYGNAEAVQTLLELGAKPDATDDEGFTALHSAAEQGFVKVVELLLAKGAPLEVPNKKDCTPLNCAALCGHREVVERLLDAGAKPDGLPAAVTTPVTTAARQGHADVLQLLLAHGGNPNTACKTDGTTPLIAAAMGPWSQDAEFKVVPLSTMNASPHGSPEDFIRCVRMLLEKGANPLATCFDGSTALHLAAKFNQAETVGLLLEAKVPAGGLNRRLLSPLHCAAQGDAAEAAAVLLEHGVKPAALMNSYTPLHAAAAAGSLKVAALLLEHGANPNQRDLKNMTPLHHAVIGGKTAFIKLLAAHHADLASRDFAYNTPLHLAAGCDQAEVVRALLEAGANPALRNLDGLTPLEVAKFGRFEACVAILSRPVSTPTNP